MCITETWFLEVGDEPKVADLAPPDYKSFSFPRASHGGGIALVVRSSLLPHLTITTDFPFHHSSFELCLMSIRLCQCCFQLFCLYRPPPSKTNKFTASLFFEELPDFLSYCNTKQGSLLLVGDFNIHVDITTDPLSVRLASLFTDFSLDQAVTFPTHQRGHSLDLVVTRREDGVLQSVMPDPTLDISDHVCVVCQLCLSSQPSPPVYVEARNLSGIDLEQFQSDLQSTLQASPNPTADQLHSLLTSLLDQHAPSTRRRVSRRASSPWFSTEGPRLLEAKRERRRAERQWLKSGLTVHKQIFRAANKLVNTVVSEAKTAYFSAKILASPTSKNLFNVTNSLLGKTKSSLLPSSSPLSELPQRFSDYFQNKVDTIRSNLDSAPSHSPSIPDLPFTGTEWNSFHSVTVDDIREILKKTTVKTCTLDPLPTSLLSHCIDDLLPHFVSIINNSLHSATFPSSFKDAIVKPLLKKPSLDPDNLKNYRPVSNLQFLSKLTEKVVLRQLIIHLQANNLFYANQSAYRAGHSTETALLKITNDLLNALDNNQVSLLSLLDLSAAFDTVDHSILLNRLHSFGISGCVLAWFGSYLSNRTQTVSINGCKSLPAPLKYGVPQGSVLGPVLFILYTQQLSSLILEHQLCHHSFSDDNQLYKSFQISQLQQAVVDTQACVSDIQSWMFHNKLQLNSDKTEIIFINSQHNQISGLFPQSVNLNGADIIPSASVRNLGVILDRNLSFQQQVSKTCQLCYFELRRISSIRRYLTEDALKTLVCAFVLSRIDYCNSLLTGCPQNLIFRLQKVQNNAARLIVRPSKFAHISPILLSLHWLPVEKRIQYKILLLTFKALNGYGPSYLSDLLQYYTPSRQLRSSSDTCLLCIPRFHRKSFGQRSFACQAPTLWNKLPQSLRYSDSLSAFKSSLKTFLFHN